MDVIVVENTETDLIEFHEDSEFIESSSVTILEYASETTESIEITTEGPIGVSGLAPAHETDEDGLIRFKNPDGSWGNWINIVIDGGFF